MPALSSPLAIERDTMNNVMLSLGKYPDADLHIVRIYWSSKPELKNVRLDTRILGRCTRVFSPFLNELLEEWLRDRVKRTLSLVYDELCLDFVIPLVYPSLQDLQIERIERFMDQYSLSAAAGYQDVLLSELEDGCAS